MNDKTLLGVALMIRDLRVRQVKQVAIKWKSLITGLEGQGQPLPLEIAVAHINKANQDFPEIEHWPSKNF